jgi:hypothetical protein
MSTKGDSPLLMLHRTFLNGYLQMARAGSVGYSALYLLPMSGTAVRHDSALRDKVLESFQKRLTLEVPRLLAPDSGVGYTVISRGGTMAKLPEILEREPLVDMQTFKLTIQKMAFHILSAMIGAQGNVADGRTVFGALVDIDSIRVLEPVDFSTFNATLEPGLQDLRDANKQKFFACLTQEAINEMGQIYA